VRRNDLRNIAIIAHVDHGKTTLVDSMLRQTGVFRSNQKVEERIMDSNDLERERGITIFSKNASIHYQGVKINLIDTPGHSDFGGEVERILRMADGVLLLVDAAEGPMPQTRFVLRKALENRLAPIVVINKIDRPDARAHEVHDEVLDLFLDLEADDAQLEFPVVYASGRGGTASLELEKAGTDLTPLFDTILERVPPPDVEADAPLQILVSNLDHNDYLGRIAIGRVHAGTVHDGDQVMLLGDGGRQEQGSLTSVLVFQHMRREATKEAAAGEIVALTGLAEVRIGDTVGSVDDPRPLPRITVDEPTISMEFTVNTSPLAGRDGRYVTSRNIRERLYREARTNVAMRVDDTDSPDTLRVSGRGVLHLSIVIENMRREGYELAVGKPRVIIHEEGGERLEPYETLVVDVPDTLAGKVIELLGPRRGALKHMHSRRGHTRMDFLVPSRGLIGLRTKLLTATRGEAVLYHQFSEYGPHAGEIPHRTQGVMISMVNGEAVAYAIFNLQERGRMFVSPGDKVYEGMVVGEHCRDNDITVNIGREKHLTNIRAAGADEAIKLVPPVVYSLEEALEYIEDDELVEITPKTIRLRKQLLKEIDRRRAARAAKE
jgi:GTP-binding protein